MKVSRLGHLDESESMSDPETYALYAIHYAFRDTSLRRDLFIGADPHESSPMPIDYYLWAIVNDNRTIVVDTGFNHDEAERRGRKVVRMPREGLAMLGIEAAAVRDVIITHMHYDHAGTLNDFPKATFHIQDLEAAYVTGRQMNHEALRQAFSAEHVCNLVHKLFEGRVAFCDGEAEIAPGVTVHRIGGHTMGMQCVRVLTQRGWVVLASDAAHFYEHMERKVPFPIVWNVEDMLQGYDTLAKLATSQQHIVPGHDPLVRSRYPSLRPDLQGAIIRLDIAPGA